MKHRQLAGLLNTQGSTDQRDSNMVICLLGDVVTHGRQQVADLVKVADEVGAAAVN